MAIISVRKEFSELHKVLGEHRWSEFLKNPAENERDNVTKVFHCKFSDSVQLEHDGWRETLFKEHWFNERNLGDNFVTNPYPKTRWCEVPRENRTGKRLCRPLPVVSFCPPARVPRPVVGTPEYFESQPLSSRNGKSLGQWAKGAPHTLSTSDALVSRSNTNVVPQLNTGSRQEGKAIGDVMSPVGQTSSPTPPSIGTPPGIPIPLGLKAPTMPKGTPASSAVGGGGMERPPALGLDVNGGPHRPSATPGQVDVGSQEFHSTSSKLIDVGVADERLQQAMASLDIHVDMYNAGDNYAAFAIEHGIEGINSNLVTATPGQVYDSLWADTPDNEDKQDEREIRRRTRMQRGSGNSPSRQKRTDEERAMPRNGRGRDFARGKNGSQNGHNAGTAHQPGKAWGGKGEITSSGRNAPVRQKPTHLIQASASTRPIIIREKPAHLLRGGSGAGVDATVRSPAKVTDSVATLIREKKMARATAGGIAFSDTTSIAPTFGSQTSSIGEDEALSDSEPVTCRNSQPKHWSHASGSGNSQNSSEDHDINGTSGWPEESPEADSWNYQSDSIW